MIFRKKETKDSKGGTHFIKSHLCNIAPNQIKMLFIQNKQNTLLSLFPASSELLFAFSSSILFCFNSVVYFPCQYFILYKLVNSIKMQVTQEYFYSSAVDGISVRRHEVVLRQDQGIIVMEKMMRH